MPLTSDATGVATIGVTVPPGTAVNNDVKRGEVFEEVGMTDVRSDEDELRD